MSVKVFSREGFLISMKASILRGDYGRFGISGRLPCTKAQESVLGHDVAEQLTLDGDNTPVTSSRLRNETAKLLRRRPADIFVYDNAAKKECFIEVNSRSFVNEAFLFLKTEALARHTWAACPNLSKADRLDLYWAQALDHLIGSFDSGPSEESIFSKGYDGWSFDEMRKDRAVALHDCIDNNKVPEDAVRSFFSVVETDMFPYPDLDFLEYRQKPEQPECEHYLRPSVNSEKKQNRRVVPFDMDSVGGQLTPDVFEDDEDMGMGF